MDSGSRRNRGALRILPLLQKACFPRIKYNPVSPCEPCGEIALTAFIGTAVNPGVGFLNVLPSSFYELRRVKQ